MLSSGISLLTDTERRFTYYDLSLGYNFLPGEVFIGRDLAMTSASIVIGGIGGTDFAGDQKFTVNFGAGYSVLPTDWLAVHVAVQDRVFNTDLFGVTKLTNNSRRGSGRPCSSERGDDHDDEARIVALAAALARCHAGAWLAPPAAPGTSIQPRRARGQGREPGRSIRARS